jgi:hypothetical protein
VFSEMAGTSGKRELRFAEVHGQARALCRP